MRNKAVLVVLAAGMGSRYGGLKQMDKIGASGEALLDYSVYDALRSGFTSVVFVIRRDIEKDFKDIVLSRMGHKVPYKLAFQELDSLLPPDIAEKSRNAGRSKPWGTMHALLCAEHLIDAPFAVINADDFYGREAYTALGKFLTVGDLHEGAIVPYKLEKTLSPMGSVTRGVCGIKDGFLSSVDELLSLKKEGGAIFNTEPDGFKRELPPDTPVSMNFWGFPQEIFPALHQFWNDFLKIDADKPKSECFVPKAADWLIKTGQLSFRVLNAESEWFGVTYQEDRATTSARIAELTRQGVYPPSLWA